MASTLNGEQQGARDSGPGSPPGSVRPRFLEDKLVIPQPSFPVLRRDRISGLIGQATRQRVTLVCAAAGSGKTVACAAWAAGAPAGRRIAWLTLDRDDEPEWFWSYLCAGLRRTRIVPADVLAELEGGPVRRFPLRLIEAAAGFPEPVVVVLDNVQELAEPALAGLDVLVRHAPPSLRLVLSARQPPALQLARLRVAGELADITGADLACTPEEADAFFAMQGIDLPAAERDELLRHTEGWMAGLRLAALRTGPGADGKPAGLAGYQPIVTDYLWDEVLARQQPETRMFLLRTSVTDRVPGGLADALTGQTCTARTLERLSRENSFVEPVGPEAAEYRYHPLLREVLRAELQREAPQEIPVLLGRAARWYGSRGQVLESVRYAAEAQDWEYAAEALTDAGAAALALTDAAELEAVLARFPAGMAADDASVATAWAAARLWAGDTDGAGAYLESAQRALPQCPAGRRPLVEPTLAALQIMHAAMLGEPGAALLARGRALAEDAQPVAASQAGHRSLGLLWFALGVCDLQRLRLPAARQQLDHADRQFGTGALASFRARARAWRALAEAWQGDLTAAEQSADNVRRGSLTAAPLAPPGQQSAGPPLLAQQASRLAALAFAHVSLSRDDLMAAQRLLDEVGQERAGWLPGEPPAAALAALTRARVMLADGDTAAARTALTRMREMHGSDHPALADVITVTEAEAALRNGDSGRARALLLLAEAGGEGARAGVSLARGWLALADGEFADALGTVQPWLDGAGSGTLPERIAGLLIAAVASRRLGSGQEAADLLERALALGEPERAYRAFLDGGQAVRSTMTVLVPPTSRYAGFAGRVLERFDAQGARPAGAADDETVRLTASERAVLCFLPSHMTNEEISQALFLSVNTVKTHLRSTYRKLGVRSRREAIARGRRLGVLLGRVVAR
jgi:LuxR family maltose regulon positive regulatory protein